MLTPGGFNYWGYYSTCGCGQLTLEAAGAYSRPRMEGARRKLGGCAQRGLFGQWHDLFLRRERAPDMLPTLGSMPLGGFKEREKLGPLAQGGIVQRLLGQNGCLKGL